MYASDEEDGTRPVGIGEPMIFAHVRAAIFPHPTPLPPPHVTLADSVANREKLEATRPKRGQAGERRSSEREQSLAAVRERVPDRQQLV